MTNVVPFASRQKPPPEPAGGLIEVSFVGAVGGILVVVMAERGHESSGPYLLTLRSAGIADARVLTLHRGPLATDEEFYGAAHNHAKAVFDALHYADCYTHLLPSQLPPPPEPA